MTPPGHRSADSLGGTPREERLGELINEFFDRRAQGEDITEEDFLAAHPEEAPELRQHLSGLDLIGRLGSSTRGHTLAVGEPGLTPRGSSARDSLASSDNPQPEIPGYDILKEIGRGGMGVVFKAVQRSTKRLVALKLLLEGPLASDTARRRFEREIALAAQLRHPNIIPIYDSGVAEGRMFYAMEHVFGLALGDYFKAHNEPPDARLRLFVKICRALSHAHQRGVIHRDLKPPNILVDGDGEPHLLDFGLAKAGAMVDTMTSVTAQIVGTPAYMSPEQAAGDPNAIDTRTDVYSLGVILYEILTGQMPYDTAAPLGKVLQNIADAEPPSPNRHDARVGDELSAIALKALEKHKDNRYQSVDAFCSDIERYLAGEPISAKPASGLYLFRKAIWKYRLAVGLVLCLLMFGASTFLIGRHAARIAQPGPSPGTVEDIAGDGQPIVRGGSQAAEDTGLLPGDEEAVRRWLEWLSRNNPEAAKLIGRVAEIGAGEDVKMAIIRLLAEQAMGEPESSTPEGQAQLSKRLDLDLPEEEFDSEAGSPGDSESQATLSVTELAESVMRLLQAGSTPSTTRPATTAPASTQRTEAASPGGRAEADDHDGPPSS